MLLDETRMRELIQESLIMTEMRESLSSAVISEELKSAAGVGKKTRTSSAAIIHDPASLSDEEMERYRDQASTGQQIRRDRGVLLSRLKLGDAPFSIVRSAWNENYDFASPSNGWMYWSSSNGWSPGTTLTGFPTTWSGPGHGGRPLMGHSMTGLITLDTSYFACIGYGHFVTHSEFEGYKRYMVPEGFDPDTGGMIETECDAPDDCRVSPEDERRLAQSEMGRSKKDNILRSDLREVAEAVRENLLAFQKGVTEGVEVADDYDPDHPDANEEGLITVIKMGRQVTKINQEMFDALVIAFNLFYVPGQISMTPDASDPWLSEAGGSYILRKILDACADKEKIRFINESNYFLELKNQVITGDGRAFQRKIVQDAQNLWDRGYRTQDTARRTIVVGPTSTPGAVRRGEPGEPDPAGDVDDPRFEQGELQRRRASRAGRRDRDRAEP